MHVHVTCSNPSRSLVIAIQAARELLREAGHRVTLSWPETVRTEAGELRLEMGGRGLAEANAVLHVASGHGEELPPELVAAAASGRPVVRWVVADRDATPEAAGATCAVARAEDVPEAIAQAAGATLG